MAMCSRHYPGAAKQIFSKQPTLKTMSPRPQAAAQTRNGLLVKEPTSFLRVQGTVLRAPLLAPKTYLPRGGHRCDRVPTPGVAGTSMMAADRVRSRKDVFALPENGLLLLHSASTAMGAYTPAHPGVAGGLRKRSPPPDARYKTVGHLGNTRRYAKLGRHGTEKEQPRLPGRAYTAWDDARWTNPGGMTRVLLDSVTFVTAPGDRTSPL